MQHTADYTAAPATLMLATRCAVCARPLLDALSVETGIGPVCRERHGFNAPDAEPDHAAAARALDGTGIAPVPGDARSTCNRVVYRLALAAGGEAGREPAVVAGAINACAALGFVRLAGVLREKLAPVSITTTGDSVTVAAPWEPEWVAASHRLPGRRWDAVRKVNTFRTEALGGVLRHFAGRVVTLDGAAVDPAAVAATLAPVPVPAPAPRPRYTLTVESGVVVLATPWDPVLARMLAAIYGRRWDPVRKVNTFPLSSRAEVERTLLLYFPAD